ncbi:hypothetical protein [Solirubrobacter ginsenosidimutans]|uniref:hypothetical protein n=1 Tax=Solirubrobacter ginsenosidimutans TaxID=490573 RepID=UPI0022CE01D5|nr:hypothetical protein [Solirubrobacter ginsenosidimutans]
MYLHLYLDRLSDVDPFLVADVTVQSGVPEIEYRVEPTPAVPAHVASRLKTHFTKLDLAKYYQRRAIEEAGIQVQYVAEELADGASPSDLQDDLRRQAGYVAAIRGVNHWRSAALVGFANSHQFTSGACTGWLPQ